MTKVEFKFDIDEKVKTQFDEPGIIVTLAVDDNNMKMYYVKTKKGTDWNKEKHLKKVKQEE